MNNGNENECPKQRIKEETAGVTKWSVSQISGLVNHFTQDEDERGS